jgi:hypothetical protein
VTSTDGQTAIRAFLFKKLVPLSREHHERLGLNPTFSYNEHHFHWLPLALSEVQEAARHFPIAVSDTHTPMLAAIVGLHNKQCLFIDRSGKWTGGYMPAYLRQMPFHVIRVRAPNGEAHPAVCVDVDSPLVDEIYPDKIIAGAGLNPRAAASLQAAKDFELGAAAAVAFARALEQSGLLLPLGAMPETADCLALRTLSMVSPARLRASPQALAPFAAGNGAAAVQACAQSLSHIANLRRLQEERYAEQEAHMRADL